MRLLTLACPNCTARLEMNADLNKCTCNYCGTQFLVDEGVQKLSVRIDDPYRVGYDIERGRQMARRQEAENGVRLAKIIGGLIEPFGELQSEVAHIRRLEERLQELGTAVDAEHTRFQYATAGIAVALIALAYAALQEPLKAHRLLLLLVGAACVGGLICVGWRYEQSRRAVRSAEAEKRRHQVNARQLHEKCRDLGIRRVPRDYRTISAMKFLRHALANHRAETLTEALNLYEDKLFKEEMLWLMKNQQSSGTGQGEAGEGQDEN